MNIQCHLGNHLLQNLMLIAYHLNPLLIGLRLVLVCILLCSIFLTNKFVTGNFGEVYKADYIPEGSSLQNAIPVAVKTIKPGSTNRDKEEFLKEMAVMSKMIHHPNIVRLYGIVTDTAAPSHLIVLEYLPHGDLRSYLRVSCYIP